MTLALYVSFSGLGLAGDFSKRLGPRYLLLCSRLLFAAQVLGTLATILQ
jgi:hypothetical protein